MAAFAPDALHNNISRELIDAEAIRAFGAKEIFGDCVTMAVHRAWDRYGRGANDAVVEEEEAIRPREIEIARHMRPGRKVVAPILAQIEPVNQVAQTFAHKGFRLVGRHNQDRGDVLARQSRKIGRHVRLDLTTRGMGDEQRHRFARRGAFQADQLRLVDGRKIVRLRGKALFHPAEAKEMGKGLYARGRHVGVAGEIPGRIELLRRTKALRRPASEVMNERVCARLGILGGIEGRVEKRVRVAQGARAFAHEMLERAARKHGRVWIVGDVPGLVEQAGRSDPALVSPQSPGRFS